MKTLRTAFASVWILVLTLSVCGTTARASDITFFVGQWNAGWYDERQFEHVDTIIENTAHQFNDVQQFDDDQIPELGEWAEANTKDGELDVIWLNGMMPSSLYPFINKEPDGSLAERWLDGGNMFINVADPFGYVSFECDGRCEENGFAGAANILDLNEGIFLPGGSLALKRTPAGETFIPSLPRRPITFRPMATFEVKRDWEVAAIFASDTGDDIADGNGARVDPAVIHNKVTNGYLAIINQSADLLWIDRPAAVSEFINNWVTGNAVGYSVEPAGKLTTVWGLMKLGS